MRSFVCTNDFFNINNEIKLWIEHLILLKFVLYETNFCRKSLQHLNIQHE